MTFRQARETVVKLTRDKEENPASDQTRLSFHAKLFSRFEERFSVLKRE